MSVAIVDFGLVVLIWITQLIVYPSFKHFPEEHLLAWHSKYTNRITIIVMPLMLLQVYFHGLQLYEHFSIYSATSAVLILLIWYNTFLLAIPLHRAISEGRNVNTSVEKLNRVNWFRTVAWSVTFALSLLH